MIFLLISLLLNLSQAATVIKLIRQEGWQPQGLFLDLIAAAVTHNYYIWFNFTHVEAFVPSEC